MVVGEQHIYWLATFKNKLKNTRLSQPWSDVVILMWLTAAAVPIVTYIYVYTCSIAMCDSQFSVSLLMLPLQSLSMAMKAFYGGRRTPRQIGHRTHVYASPSTTLSSLLMPWNIKECSAKICIAKATTHQFTSHFSHSTHTHTHTHTHAHTHTHTHTHPLPLKGVAMGISQGSYKVVTALVKVEILKSTIVTANVICLLLLASVLHVWSLLCPLP